jgi:hypothetical protein
MGNNKQRSKSKKQKLVKDPLADANYVPNENPELPDYSGGGSDDQPPHTGKRKYEKKGIYTKDALKEREFWAEIKNIDNEKRLYYLTFAKLGAAVPMMEATELEILSNQIEVIRLNIQKAKLDRLNNVPPTMMYPPIESTSNDYKAMVPNFNMYSRAIPSVGLGKASYALGYNWEPSLANPSSGLSFSKINSLTDTGVERLVEKMKPLETLGVNLSLVVSGTKPTPTILKHETAQADTSYGNPSGGGCSIVEKID